MDRAVRLAPEEGYVQVQDVESTLAIRMAYSQAYYRPHEDLLQPETMASSSPSKRSCSPEEMQLHQMAVIMCARHIFG